MNAELRLSKAKLKEEKFQFRAGLARDIGVALVQQPVTAVIIAATGVSISVAILDEIAKRYPETRDFINKIKWGKENEPSSWDHFFDALKGVFPPLGLINR